MTTGDTLETDEVGLELLLDVVYRLYHYDFRGYVRSALARRLADVLPAIGVPTLRALRDRIVRDPQAAALLVSKLTVQVSDLFRDPDYFRELRDEVIPHLATHPSIRIWVAGCSTGEEVYSLAILLHEAGVLERTRIYATDIDRESLRIATAGVYAIDRVPTFTRNYQRSGGTHSLADYYTAGSGRVRFSDRLRAHILFADHSLATDAVFAEVHLVSCRNVLIYFDRDLQDRVVTLFRDALIPRGFLGLGASETLTLSAHEHVFETHAADERIYRLKKERVPNAGA